MTEKRFKINMEDECIDDAKNEILIDFNDKIDFYELCELLNEQHEEIEHLKAVIKDVEHQRDYVHPKYDECRKCVKNIFEENEQLKFQLNECRNHKLFSRRKLEKENEELKEEIAKQKYTKRVMRDNIKDYEKAIKRLRKSFEDFDEIRLKRIRFLEKRLKKNGLSIYVNGCGDLE